MFWRETTHKSGKKSNIVIGNKLRNGEKAAHPKDHYSFSETGLGSKETKYAIELKRGVL